MISIEDEIWVDIKDTIESMFSIRVIEHSKISRGLLNLKWKVMTNNGTFFIKQYNEQRYPTSKERRWSRLHNALLFQKRLREEGVRCPHISTCNGDVILRTKQNTRFIITAFSGGNLVDAGKINCNQFYDLGVELGKMHQCINRQMDEKATARWIVPSKEQLMAEWDEKWMLSKGTNTADMNKFLQLQKEIFEDLDMNLFKGSKPGWAHSDLWCDNVLFYPDSLSAILDFDRFQYIYPELDLSRAILSFALDGECLRMDAVKAFVDGYNHFGDITAADIIRSIKLLYCLESFWWLNDERFYGDGPPKRFADEMVWLTTHWQQLERIIGESYEI